mgnify:CR=1 FL=1
MAKQKSKLTAPGGGAANEGHTTITGTFNGKIDDASFQAPDIPNQPWMADPIIFAGVSFRGDGERPGVYFRLKFSDFMNVWHEIEVSRVDCFMNFPSVLARLVNLGYCMDITNPEAVKQIQRRLTLMRIDPKVMKEFIKKAQAASSSTETRPVN